jgi:NADPH:quinone reductase-like Zn-dependent oxidoreductase
MIATQLAVAQGVKVIGIASPRDHDLVRDLGAVQISYGAGMADRVREVTASVDVVLDAAGKGELAEAVFLAGGPSRVMTIADEHAAELGVSLSVATPDRAPEALDQTMPLLASGALRLRRQRKLPMAAAAEAHRLTREWRGAREARARSSMSPRRAFCSGTVRRPDDLLRPGDIPRR